MKIIKNASTIIVLLGIFVASNAFGDESSSRRKGRRHHGPPSEDYTACENLNAGEVTEFVSLRGDTVTGTCEQEGDRLVLRPDRFRKDSDSRTNESSLQKKRRRHHGPPPEAYTACEGKNAGDVSEFVSPRGDNMAGTCEQAGDRLVLRPDRPRKNSDAGANNDAEE